MKDRTPGKDESTTRRILQAAAKLFAENGFPGTTVRHICAKADVNLALVNYHFRSKAGLYQSTWRNAVALADRLYPIDGGAPPDAPPEDRLRRTIRALLSRMTDKKRLGNFHRMIMTEMANPTGLVGEVVTKMIERNRTHLTKVVRSLLGQNGTKQDVDLCDMSIVSQCLMARPRKQGGPIRPPLSFTSKDVDRLTDHITGFSLAGIAALRRNIEERKG